MGIFDRELDGRIARRNIAEYDVLIAEIAEDRMAEKCKVRNRRKQDRKHKLLPKDRKHAEYMRSWNRIDMMVNFCTWDDIPIVEGRMRNFEQTARADWELEKANHAEAMRLMHEAESIAESWESAAAMYGGNFDTEVDSYIAEARKIHADEAYFRKSQSFGIPARIYAGISYCGK